VRGANLTEPCRKLVAKSNPTVVISKDGEEWTMEFKISIKTNKIVFKMGEEFTENSPLDSSPQKALATVEDGALLITTDTPKGRITRTLVFTEEGMVMVRRRKDGSSLYYIDPYRTCTQWRKMPRLSGCFLENPRYWR
jgi:hypothetical protein